MKQFVIFFLIFFTGFQQDLVYAQNLTGNRWHLWLPELGNTGAAPNAAFSIMTQDNTLKSVVGNSSANTCNSYAIGNDKRGYVYYDDAGSYTIRAVQPGTNTVVGSFNYQSLGISYIHSFQSFFVAATQQHYLVVSSGIADVNVAALGIFNITNPSAISFVKAVKFPGLVQQYSGSVPSTVAANRTTGLVIHQDAYTSAATTMYAVCDNAVISGSTTTITTSGGSNYHPGVFVKITDPLAGTPTISYFEAYYASGGHFLAPETPGSNHGPHQLALDDIHHVLYLTSEGYNKILSFDVSGATPIATNVVYTASAAANGGNTTGNSTRGFHSVSFDPDGLEFFVGRAYSPAGQGANRALMFSITSSPGSHTELRYSPDLSSNGANKVKAVLLTPDAQYLYAITERNPARVILLNEADMSVVSDVINPVTGSAAAFSFLDPHSFAFTLYEYGDAPQSYGMAEHFLANADYVNDRLRIGTTIDADSAYNPSALSNSDDIHQTPRANDEDGITPAMQSSLPGLYYGMTGNYTINNITVKNTTANAATLAGWIDFNHNGVFETQEGTSIPVPVNSSSVNLTWSIPADVTSGALQIRLRLSTDPSLTTATASSAAFDGEAEDYYIPPVPVSGSLFNDLNANTIKAGGEVNITSLSPVLYLVKNGVIVDSAHTATDGSYQFRHVGQNMSNASIVAGTNSLAPGSAATGITNIQSNPPTGWVYTGESSASSTGGSDGTLAVSVTTSTITQQNFGLQRLPESSVNQQPVQVNPGGTVNVTIPAAAFLTSNTGTNPNTLDYDGGTVNSIRITAFPLNVTSITVNGVTYTSSSWPVAGIIVPYTNGAGPSQSITFDPVNGNVNVSIPFAAIDNAGYEDTTPGSVTYIFTSTLPVKLTGFDAVVKNSIVYLNWESASEINFSRYIVEYGTDGRNYQQLTEVAAKGDNNRYQATHIPGVSGKYYYRLKLVDADGQFEYSRIVTVDFENATSKFSVFPNPVQKGEHIHISIYSSTSQQAQMNIINNSGQKICTVPVSLQQGVNTIDYNTSNIAAGSYYILISGSGADSFKNVQKLIVR